MRILLIQDAISSSDVTWIFKVGEGVQNARGLTLHTDASAFKIAEEYEGKCDLSKLDC